MKKLLPVLIALFSFTFSAKAQYVTIPDATFRQFLVSNYPSCFNASSMLDTTCSAVVNQTVLNMSDVGNILNWDGFQYFKNLIAFNCSSYAFSSLPVLPNSLKELRADGLMQLASWPILSNGLTLFSCESSALGSQIPLPVLPNSLLYLDCSYNSAVQLQSLTSLPTSLKYFDCQSSELSSLPALPASLDTLQCSGCGLLLLPSLPASLKYLACSRNGLTVLPALPAGLKYIECGNNQISALPSLPAQLEYLDATSNMLTSVPAMPATLKVLSVTLNHGITTLPALSPVLEKLSFAAASVSIVPTLPATLTNLDCGSNPITSLPSLPNGLQVFGCNGDQLTALPTLPQALTYFDCSNNSLTSLPSLPNGITKFFCRNNQLTSLPPLPQSLDWFECDNNQIYFMPAIPASVTKLECTNNNMTCLPVLPEQAQGQSLEIFMDGKIGCVPNQPANVYISYYDSVSMNTFMYIADYPFCSVVNNIHHCEAFPLMTGYAYNDNNNNNIKDANEPYRANVKVQLSNGAFTITNSNGYYQIPADSIGNYSITATVPNFFAAVPSQYNYNFNSYDTLVRGDFALQATSTVDSLTISVLPINWAARPGFSYPYLISYQNVGTTTLSPNIVFNYDNTRLIYDSSSNAAVTNSGSALSLAESGFVAGLQKAFVGYFTVKPTAVIGDSIRANVSIHANAITAIDSTIAEIRGSYDPNDKTATPALSPSQVANGNYIYYTIRFQNTGTDTAFSVVITDTLNSQLQAATLQVINTSHPAKITVKENVVYFEFINILLPDSNVNEMKSHGYVTFRIKPQPTVTLNSVIPNKAAIYFDYNSPVITNTAVTNIVEPQGPVPLKLLSFNVIRSTGNNANAFWNTSNEINVQSYNIEMSIDGRNFSSISSERAKGFQYNDYTKTISIPTNDLLYFRLKMIDVDGRFTYSPIVTLRNEKSQSFSFLNNPVKNELNISIQDDGLQNTTAKIYNAQGILVKTILLQHEIETVNVRSLPAGTYYLVTENGSRQFIIVK
ncbi:MAG: T9SS type A sorting domain-containing protein [Ferruginibacter sp.]